MGNTIGTYLTNSISPIGVDQKNFIDFTKNYMRIWHGSVQIYSFAEDITEECHLFFNEFSPINNEYQIYVHNNEIVAINCLNNHFSIVSRKVAPTTFGFQLINA